jgi:hypothetical protein
MFVRHLSVSPLRVCLSADISEASTGRISVKFGIGDFYERFLRTPNLVKMGQNYETLYVNI